MQILPTMLKGRNKLYKFFKIDEVKIKQQNCFKIGKEPHYHIYHTILMETALSVGRST